MTDDVDRMLLLKQSLSDTLVRFYPLAGRLKDTYIDCNDEGAEFYEANVVSVSFLDVIEKNNLEELRGLLPFEVVHHERKTVLGVQVSHFTCGGTAIGMCLSHKMADGAASVYFMKAWAIANMAQSRRVPNVRDDDWVPNPIFDGASYFPQRNLDGMSEWAICWENLVTRRFIFNKTMIEALKEKVGGVQVKKRTRVEVVSAFLWQRFMKAKAEAASETSSDDIGIMTSSRSRITHAVNLRSRMEPPLLEGSFGNFIWFTITNSASTESQLSELVLMLRSAIRKYDDKYIKTLQQGAANFFQTQLKDVGVGTEKTEVHYMFTSTSAFPIYEVNFGWGEPTRATFVTVPGKNLVILSSTSCGQGIEAWVHMVEEDIAMIERDPELFLLTT